MCMRRLCLFLLISTYIYGCKIRPCSDAISFSISRVKGQLTSWYHPSAESYGPGPQQGQCPHTSLVKPSNGPLNAGSFLRRFDNLVKNVDLAKSCPTRVDHIVAPLLDNPVVYVSYHDVRVWELKIGARDRFTPLCLHPLKLCVI